MKLLRYLAATTIFLLVTATSAAAHGSIYTFKYIDGANMVMVTHNVHDAVSGIPISYNIRLYSLGGQLVPFQKVHATMKQGDSLLQAQDLPFSANNDANLTFTYPHQGAYTLTLSFIDNDKQVSHAEFPIAVQKGLGESLLIFIAHTAIVFLFGLGAGLALLRRDQLKARLQKALVHLKVLRTRRTAAPKLKRQKANKKEAR
ncbi:MAG TPA: hypothetical protein VFO38_05970 [Candidatus Saccharimonadales bacterium]|nr:hypothetical protein [Candidatus Saccharimonadales bacterium]